jgi:hypothetical protein
MTIWRIDIGLWTTERPLTLKDYLLVEYDKGLCGCHILTISRMYFTFMGNECYYHKETE